MDSNNFKKLLEESLKPLQQDLNEVRGGLNEVRRDLKEVKDTQEQRVLPAVTYIETNIKAYKDSYQINNANAKKLEKRVEALEDQAGITPPPEHTLAEVN